MSPAVRVSPDDRQAFRVVATKSSPDMKFGVVCRSEDGVVTIMALEEESILYKCGLLEGDEVLVNRDPFGGWILDRRRSAKPRLSD